MPKSFRHLVKEKGEKAMMLCTPQKGHTVVYWYQQNHNKELKFLIYFQNQQLLDQIDMIKERFSAQCPSNSACSLEILSYEPGDSALHLCASSQSIVLKCSFPPVHKLVVDPTQEAGDELGWKELIEINWTGISHNGIPTQG
jgi:T-cell receptor beta chain V region